MVEFFATIFLAFGTIFLAMGGLAVGVLMGRGAPSASCGGNALLKHCPLCKIDDDPA